MTSRLHHLRRRLTRPWKALVNTAAGHAAIVVHNITRRLDTINSWGQEALANFHDRQFRGGPNHDGVYASDGPRDFHRVKWMFPTGDRIVSSPVMQDATLYFGSDDGNVYDLDYTSPSAVRLVALAADGRPVFAVPR